MKLHWSPRSPFVRKVMIAAHELGLADRLHTVRTIVGLSALNPGLLPENPLNRIPTLVLDDGTVLFDSLVIIEYLDSLGAPRLVPPPGPARWQALAWHALGSGLLEVLVLWRAERDKPAPMQTPDWTRGFAAKTQATLDRLEQLSSELTAPEFGVGHIAIGCALSYLDFRFPAVAWRVDRTGLAAWYDAFAARPSAMACALAEG